ncbi:sugar-phosphatase [Clostridium sp. DL1XJH146]
MYKLIAIDMDGTLLNEEKKITKENYEAIMKAKEMGVKIVLSTGRPLNGILDYLKELNLFDEDCYSVVYNGSVVRNNHTGDIIYEKTITFDDLISLGDISKEIGFYIHALTPNGVITPKMNKYTQIEADINKIPIKEIDFREVSPNEEIIKVLMVQDPEIIDDLIEKLPKNLHTKYHTCKSAPFFFEFLNTEATKGLGVQKIAELLGIKQKEVICIGDAGNDLQMIEYAGLGVAMENAFDEVKKVADYITKSHTESGVAHVINKFVLNK